jgi:hypothetical protein
MVQSKSIFDILVHKSDEELCQLVLKDSETIKDMLFTCVNIGYVEGVKRCLRLDVFKYHVLNYLLGEAAEKGYNEIIRTLVEHGADLEFGNNYCLSAAKSQGHESTVKLIEDLKK